MLFLAILAFLAVLQIVLCVTPSVEFCVLEWPLSHDMPSLQYMTFFSRIRHSKNLISDSRPIAHHSRHLMTESATFTKYRYLASDLIYFVELFRAYIL